MFTRLEPDAPSWPAKHARRAKAQMSRPLFSVVIATYGRGEHIRPTIELAAGVRRARISSCSSSATVAPTRPRRRCLSYGSAKIRWLNREEDLGSQSAPKTSASSIAEGDLVADLGCDGIRSSGSPRSASRSDPQGADDRVPGRLPASSMTGCRAARSIRSPVCSKKMDGEVEVSFLLVRRLADCRELEDRIGGWRPPRSTRCWSTATSCRAPGGPGRGSGLVGKSRRSTWWPGTGTPSFGRRARFYHAAPLLSLSGRSRSSVSDRGWSSRKTLKAGSCGRTPPGFSRSSEAGAVSCGEWVKQRPCEIGADAADRGCGSGSPGSGEPGVLSDRQVSRKVPRRSRWSGLTARARKVLQNDKQDGGARPDNELPRRRGKITMGCLHVGQRRAVRLRG